MGPSKEQKNYAPVSGDVVAAATASPEGMTEPILQIQSRTVSPSRKKFGVAAALALLVVVAIGVSLRGRKNTSTFAMPEAFGEMKDARHKKETNQKKNAKPKQPAGSWFQTSCLSTKACKCPGQVCYRKNRFWAMCMESCDPDIPEVDEHGKKHYWNCSELGERTPAAPKNGKCSGDTEDCRSSRCCQGKGMQCFSKNEYWATCKSTCTKGVDPKDADNTPWECKELGPRTPGIPFQDAKRQELSKCAWDQGNCINSKCCKVQGSTCFQKDSTWATCEKTCAEKPAIGGQWSCKVLGGAPDLPEPLTASVKDDNVAGFTLFCFTVVMPNTYEVALVGTQKKNKIGIFGCDASAVFQGAAAPHGKSIKMIAIPKVFQTIWEEVKKDKQYLDYDWTVKSEPDVVFFPERLSAHLSTLNAPKTPGIYVKNSYAKWGLIGAIQVYSKEAMETYFKNHDECSIGMVTQAEDVYMMTCLDVAGVRYMRDDMMLNDQNTFNFVVDMQDVSYCADVRFASYRPYKDVDNWMQCHALSAQAVKKKCPALSTWK